jgi:hypothetical protein
MEACSELRGEKWVVLKPPIDCPQSRGHMNSSPKVISREELACR